MGLKHTLQQWICFYPTFCLMVFAGSSALAEVCTLLNALECHSNFGLLIAA